MVAASAQKLSRFTLTAMVVGSMVGAGIFSLPRTFGSATGPFGAILAWSIACRCRKPYTTGYPGRIG